jgi:hypothetical protein
MYDLVMEENPALRPATDTESIKRFIEENRMLLAEAPRLREERRLKVEKAKHRLDNARILLGRAASRKTVRLI